jgi:preprotein translocase subunit YajC
MTGAVEAKKNKNTQGGLKGTIVSVSANSISIKTHANKKTGAAASQMTIKADATTTVEVNGAAGKTLKDLQAGEKVVITGDPTAVVTDIQATTKSKHHKHPA